MPSPTTFRSTPRDGRKGLYTDPCVVLDRGRKKKTRFLLANLLSFLLPFHSPKGARYSDLARPKIAPLSPTEYLTPTSFDFYLTSTFQHPSLAIFPVPEFMLQPEINRGRS